MATTSDIAASSSAPPPALSSSSSSTPPQRARFRVKFSDVVLAFPKGAQQHPSYLNFSFDSFWQAETGPTAPPPSEAETHHPLAFRSYSNNSNKCKLLDRPEPELRFIYETSLASKLHRKKLVLTLTLPPESSVPHATAIISIDALARGCQRIALTFQNPHAPTALPIATAHFRVSVLHFERVQAVLSDVKVEDYPEKHIHDVKLLYIEMGYTPFAEGPVNPTERCSDAEPVFNTLPTLEKVCSLQEMLHGGVARTDLRVCFALHRQVARALTEEIGVGALPIHLLFPKVVNGRMEEPARIKVPLGGFKGVVRAKIILHNIPQWSQLGGDDLVNRDGVITPSSVDLNSRKLLSWMKLPRTSSSGRRLNVPSPSVRPFASPSNMVLMPSGPSSITAPDQPSSQRNLGSHLSQQNLAMGNQQFAASQQSLGSHQMSHHGPGGMHVSAPSAKWPEAAPFMLPPNTSAGQPGGMTPSVPPGRGGPMSPVEGSSFSEQDAAEREKSLQLEYQRQHEEYQRNTHFAPSNMSVAPPPSANYLQCLDQSAGSIGMNGNAGPPWTNGSYGVGMYGSTGPPGMPGHLPPPSANYLPELEQSAEPLDNGVGEGESSGEPMPTTPTPGQPGSPGSTAINPSGKSTKSIGSSTTGYEGNSPPQSAASDDGHQEAEDWVAVLDGSSNRVYFANSATNESLWLPPMWEQLVDGDGRPFFVDHNSQTTQREFPADESRSYKMSVSVGTGRQ